MSKSDYKFYVYEILDTNKEIIYVGKGSGSRMATSKRHRNGAFAREIARFINEEDAYDYEIEHIASVNPVLNKHIGGNGSRYGMHKGCKLDKQTLLMNRIGTKAYSARMLINYYLTFKKITSKVDASTKHLLKHYTKDVKDALNGLNLAKLYEVGYGIRS